jgi:pyruvate-formate lyase-activating enzyme
MGVKTVAVTAGYVAPDARAEFFAHMDAANVDLKGFTDRFYHDLCSGRLDPVLGTLVYLKRETNVWFEITTLLIPGENDGNGEIDALSRWVATELGPDVKIRIHLAVYALASGRHRRLHAWARSIRIEPPVRSSSGTRLHDQWHVHAAPILDF